MPEAIIARLETLVPDLVHRVSDAFDFTKLMASGKLPHAGVQAYVLPLGLTGGTPDVSAGLFEQNIKRAFALVLFTQSTDSAGQRAMERLGPLIDEMIQAVCGWAPSDEVGVFVLRRANIIPAGQGLLGYQIDIEIDDQLRITS